MEPLRFPANKLPARSQVFQIIKERSFGRGVITLASGKQSDFYFDMKPTMLHPEGATLLAQLILQKIDGLNIDYVGGLAVGAVPLLSPLAMESFRINRPLPCFFVRNQVKDHGTKLRIEGLGRGETLKDKRVVILDDVTTTGASAMIAVDEARDAGATVILVLAVVDRLEGAEEFYMQKGIPFSALFRADEFLQS